MHPVSCLNVYHDISDLVNHGIQKLEYLENGTKIFNEIKKFLSCASDDTFCEIIIL